MQNSAISVIFQENNIKRLFEGLFVTAEIAFISIIIGSILGILIGLSRTTNRRRYFLLTEFT